MCAPRFCCAAGVFLLLSASACEKKSTLVVPAAASDGSAGSAESSGTTAAAGVALRYQPKAGKFRQRVSWEMSQRGAGQYAELAVDLVIDVDVVPQRDRLKILWNVQDVAKLELKGALEVQPGDDPQGYLRSNGKGAYLTDLLGETDVVVSDALPENAARRDLLDAVANEVQAKTAKGESVRVPAGPQLLGFVLPVVQLPSLPSQTLPLGKALEIKHSEETQLGDHGLVLPIETSLTYTLVQIDTSGGARIAELQFVGNAVGSTQTPGGLVAIDSRSEGFLLFDVDARVPVSYEVSRTESFEMGELSGETTTIIRSAWEVR